MKLLRLLLGGLTLALGLGVLGCEKWREQTVRHNQKDDSFLIDKADPSALPTKKIDDLDSSIPRGERSSIRSGMFSAEARELESHFDR